MSGTARFDMGGTEKPLIATGRICGENDYLANIACPCVSEFVNQVCRAAALLIRCMGLLMLLWSLVLIKVTDLLQSTPYTQAE